MSAPSQSTESAGLDTQQRRLDAILVRVVHVVERAAVGLGLHVVRADLGWLGLADHEVSVAVLDDDERHKNLLLVNAQKEVITCDNSANSRKAEHLNSANTEQMNITNYLLNL